MTVTQVLVPSTEETASAIDVSGERLSSGKERMGAPIRSVSTGSN
jgi:hypothetical protein